ncbi:MAG: hypothetical protein FWC89_01880 [Defluviitaleaceae bacterium]|nr:hypothetical protein [Defluviitaleaceae bacterium]
MISQSALRNTIFKTLATMVVAFLFVVAFPLAVSAAPAVTNFSMDRTSVTAGQNITFSVRTTQQTNFVFAVLDGVRVQGTRVAGNDWSVTVVPTHTTNVTIFANSVNNETGAASVTVPITVTGANLPGTPATVPAMVPPAPANLAPIAIASVTETPATAANFVQLTVVAGAEVNEVWVHFDRNAGDGRFARGRMISQDANSRIFTIDFRPTSWATQQVEIGANRTYNWPGAARQMVNLTLSQPFVAPAVPQIQTVTINPSSRNVAHNQNVSFTIRTNNDVEHVWIRDADGREFTANRGSTSGTQRTWTISFNPVRTGNVTIYANTTRTTTGAVTRQEHINVGQGGSSGWGWASIVNANANWQNNNDVRITATTNRDTATVWAVLGDGRRIQLNENSTGSGNRQWEAWASNVPSGNIVIHVSSTHGNINNLNSEDSRNVGWGGGNNHQQGRIISAAFWQSGFTSVRQGEEISFRVRTSSDVQTLSVTGTHVAGYRAHPGQITGNEREFYVAVTISNNAPIDSNLSLTVHSTNDSRALPSVRVNP